MEMAKNRNSAGSPDAVGHSCIWKEYITFAIELKC
jgi:hypothetical protein